jgi:hypothetical protein
MRLCACAYYVRRSVGGVVDFVPVNINGYACNEGNMDGTLDSEQVEENIWHKEMDGRGEANRIVPTHLAVVRAARLETDGHRWLNARAWLTRLVWLATFPRARGC